MILLDPGSLPGNLQGLFDFLFLFWPQDPTLTMGWFCSTATLSDTSRTLVPFFHSYFALENWLACLSVHYFLIHKIEVMSFCVCGLGFVKVKGLAQSNNRMETVGNLALLTFHTFLMFTLPMSLLLSFLSLYPAFGVPWYLSLFWFFSFLISVPTSLFSLLLPDAVLYVSSHPAAFSNYGSEKASLKWYTLCTWFHLISEQNGGQSRPRKLS